MDQCKENTLFQMGLIGLQPSQGKLARAVAVIRSNREETEVFSHDWI